MKTNFFENIANMQVPGKWNITIHTDDKGQFTVSTYFAGIATGDNASQAIPPLLSKGTAEEMDEGYFEAIENPVQQTAGLLTNMEDYLKGLSKAKEQSKMIQDNKTKGAKEKSNKTDDGIEVPSAENKEEKRKAYTEIIRQIVELDGKCQYDEALELLPSVADYPDKEAEISKRTADLERKREQKKQLLF